MIGEPTVGGEFSKRHGFRESPVEVIREDAPAALRTFVLRHVSEETASDIHQTRKFVTRILGYVPDPSNQSVDQIWAEIRRAIEGCDWFLIYDLIEGLYRYYGQTTDWQTRRSLGAIFLEEVNDCFRMCNLGWEMRVVHSEDAALASSEIVSLGTEAFEAIMSTAPSELVTAGLATASEELHKAIEDLSRRPTPDLTGAVQHGMAALECASRQVCRLTGKETLGDAVKARPDLFHPPLNEAITKLWGFASNKGRHLKEGGEPTRTEAELVVGIAASVATYLSRIMEP